MSEDSNCPAYFWKEISFFPFLPHVFDHVFILPILVSYCRYSVALQHSLPIPSTLLLLPLRLNFEDVLMTLSWLAPNNTMLAHECQRHNVPT